MAGVLSRLIPGTCKVYAEMYCGSAALALNSRKFDVKILNDFNPHIANFWKVATAPETQGLLMERLQHTSYSRSLFQAAKRRRDSHGAKQSDPIQWAVDTYTIINSLICNGHNGKMLVAVRLPAFFIFGNQSQLNSKGRKFAASSRKIRWCIDFFRWCTWWIF